jgi:hypothetical protein
MRLVQNVLAKVKVKNNLEKVKNNVKVKNLEKVKSNVKVKNNVNNQIR